MTHIDPARARALAEYAREALRVSQAGLAVVTGSSLRTVSRWAAGTSVPDRSHLLAMARAVLPVEPGLAEALASTAGTTLAEAGLEVLAPARPPPAGRPAPQVALADPPGPTGPPARPPAALEYLVDSVVCAAAAAIQVTPQAIRPALAAAFERAIALSVTPEEMRAGLKGGGAAGGED